MANDRKKQHQRSREHKRSSADEILDERLADLTRRWDELTYEQRMEIVLDIDREYRAYLEDLSKAMQ